jgi:hypothetical protein
MLTARALYARTVFRTRVSMGSETLCRGPCYNTAGRNERPAASHEHSAVHQRCSFTNTVGQVVESSLNLRRSGLVFQVIRA